MNRNKIYIYYIYIIYTIIIIQYNKYNKTSIINEKLLILLDIFLHSRFTLPFVKLGNNFI